MQESAAVWSSRWRVLGAYALLAACTQMLWLTFAPVDTDAASALHVEVGSVGDLAAVFPFVYIVLAMPTGRWLDARFGQALAAGALLTGAGALVRLAGPGSFGWLLAGQLVIAAGQPLVLNAITTMAALYFPEKERPTAIAIGSAALFTGILAAVLGGQPLLHAGGLRLLLGVQATASVIGAGLVLAALRVTPDFSPVQTATVSLRWIAGDRLLWSLAALVFVGVGTYNTMATWLQPILARSGEGAVAGDLVAAMTFAGILGAAVLPAAVAARGRRRPMLVGALVLSAATLAAIAVRREQLWVGAWLVADGFLLMACLPVVLDWSEVHVGAGRQAAAVGFLFLAGNIGGLVLVLMVQSLLGSAYLALGALAAVSLVAVGVALRLPARASP